MIRPFKYEIQTKIVFGCGVVSKTGAELEKYGAKKVVIITDKGVSEAGLISKLADPLSALGIKYLIYDKVPSDSDAEIVAEVAHMAKAENCQVVIGIGGGSSMDTAKAVAAMVTNSGNIMDYAGMDKLKHPPLPVFAIPTTAGTGSEVTLWSVIIDRKRNFKIGIGSAMLMPRVALCDPDLTISLPPHITAATGMDALSHAIESYVCTATQPISEALAEKAITLISESLRLAVAKGGNIIARENMLMGSLLAALAFNETRLGIAHSWALPLGGHFPISHGLVNSILLPHVMEFNLIGSPQKYARIARLMGENTDGLNIMEAARKAVTAVKNLTLDIGMPQGLKEVIDINDDDILRLAHEAIQSGNNLVNPRQPSLNDLVNICTKSI